MKSLMPGNVIGGKYRLERPLARGGMGTVWIACHLQLDVLFAIKFIDPAMTASGNSSNARARFEREAKASAQIRNPNVVQVFDHGVDADTPYIVMELLEGEDLGSRLRREKRLPLDQVVSLANQLAKGLRRAHETGIVHRDLKPGNIFMTRVEEEEVVKILDFGLAKAFANDANDDVTVSGVVLGSPHYMSPEQARGSKGLDHRSDLWSIGIILYRCLTGSVPFQGDQVGDLVVKICTEPIKPPSQLVSDLPPGIDRFFERALARDPDQRFQTVRELSGELTALAGRASIPDVAVWPGPSSNPSPLRGPISSPIPHGAPSPMSTPLPLGMASPLSSPSPLASPIPGLALRPSDVRSGPLVDTFRDPLSPSRPGYGAPDWGGSTKETTTVPAMVPASPQQRRPPRSVLFGVAGGAFVVTLAVVGFLVARSPAPPEPDLAAAPTSGAAANAPLVQASAAAPNSAPSAEVSAAATVPPVEMLLDDPDAGAAPAPAATHDAAPRASGPIKKKRNFGY